jgi:hypothetical protein
MLERMSERGPLAILAATVAWALMALAFDLTSDAPWRSVMWPLFERLFELLAVFSSIAWLAVVIWRGARPRRDTSASPIHLAT